MNVIGNSEASLMSSETVTSVNSQTGVWNNLAKVPGATFFPIQHF